MWLGRSHGLKLPTRTWPSNIIGLKCSNLLTEHKSRSPLNKGVKLVSGLVLGQTNQKTHTHPFNIKRGILAYICVPFSILKGEDKVSKYMIYDDDDDGFLDLSCHRSFFGLFRRHWVKVGPIYLDLFLVDYY